MFVKSNSFFPSSHSQRVIQITKIIVINIITVQFKWEKHFLSIKMKKNNGALSVDLVIIADRSNRPGNLPTVKPFYVIQI